MSARRRLALWALSVLVALVPAPASLYDKPGVRHNEQCVPTLRGASVLVRGLEGEQLRTLASVIGGLPANGSVTARYGYVSNGSERLYGWMVSSHTFEGMCFDHMAYAGGGPPLAGTLCPADALSDSIGDGLGLGPDGLGSGPVGFGL